MLPGLNASKVYSATAYQGMDCPGKEGTSASSQRGASIRISAGRAPALWRRDVFMPTRLTHIPSGLGAWRVARRAVSHARLAHPPAHEQLLGRADAAAQPLIDRPHGPQRQPLTTRRWDRRVSAP